MRMEFRILGPTEVWAGDNQVALPQGRGRALLALLALHAGEAVSVDRIIDELWGEHPPPTSGTVVHGLVSKLRRVLEPGWRRGSPPAVLGSEGHTYRLTVNLDDVDAHRFQRLVAEARVAPERREELLTEALDLWRGPALADFTYEPFAQRAITALEEQRLVAVELRAEAGLEHGRHDALVAELRALVAAHPFRERLTSQLMLALYRSGRQAEALAAYRDAREVLATELGVEPGPPLRDLHRAVLAQDPSLALPRAPSEPPGPVSPRPWLPRERRAVTALSVEITITAPAGVDPEGLARLGERARAAATDVLSRHGARVEVALGDTLVGLFGLPLAHEDDAGRAARAGLELVRTVRALRDDGTTYSCRVGIDSGDVVVGGPDVASGPLVTESLHAQRSAGADEVVVGASALRLVRGTTVVRAVDGTLPRVWRVLEVVDAPPIPRFHEAPIRGRQEKLTRVRAAFRMTARTGSARRLTVLGDAGIGKTRLALELATSLGDEAHVVTGRCPPYGEGITFLPLREAVDQAVRRVAGTGGTLADLVDAADAAAVSALLGLGGPSDRPGAAVEAVGRLLASVAAKRPLVVVLDDLHWGQPTLLEVVDSLGSSLRAPLLLLGLARPELAERHPSFVAGAGSVSLVPLPSDAIEEILADRNPEGVSRETVARISSAAGGNPLFAEQLLAAREEVGLDNVPETLRGLLALRLDRLGPGERDVLRRASVAGASCSEEELAALLPADAEPFLARHVTTLQRKRLLYRDGSELRFAHVLVQRAAYQSLARDDRAQLHEQYADHLAAQTDPPPELDELVGYHLEQAVTHGRAAGRRVPSELAGRAGGRLARAAGRAMARIDQAAAENLLSRARALLPPGDALWSPVTQQLAEVCLVLGRFVEAQRLLDERREAALAAGDRATELAAGLERARIQFIIGPDPVPLAEVRRVADEARAELVALGNDAGVGRARFLQACVELRRGAIGAAERDFRASLGYADAAADMRERMASRWLLAMTAVQGPVAVPDAIALCEGWAIVDGARHPGVLTELARLHAMAGDVDRARELNATARIEFVERMRTRRMLMYVAESTATVEQLAGDQAAAEAALRDALALGQQTAELDHISQAAARLSLLLFDRADVERADVERADVNRANVNRANGDTGEAVELAALSAARAPAEGVLAVALSRTASARAESAVGRHRRAAELARAAVDVVPNAMPNLRGDVLLQLARVLRRSVPKRGPGTLPPKRCAVTGGRGAIPRPRSRPVSDGRRPA